MLHRSKKLSKYIFKPKMADVRSYKKAKVDIPPSISVNLCVLYNSCHFDFCDHDDFNDHSVPHDVSI